MSELLEIHGLRVERGGREVLHGIDLTVSAGETVAVLGPNGAGKSTLVNAVAGVLAVRAGTIRRHGRVAAVMQSPGLARRSARANVEVAMAWWGVPRGERRARADAALELMQAAHLARRAGRSLSGGEQRRVHLARAIAVRPDVLLLDEPFDGLDPQTRVSLRDDTVGALRDGAGAVVAIVHDRADAWAIATRVAVLIDGRICADAPPAELLAAPPSAEVARFLGYDGELTMPGNELLLTRATHLRIDPSGDLDGTVVRTVGIEDGVRALVRTGRGEVWCVDPACAVRAGDAVRLAVVGGARFPSGG